MYIETKLDIPLGITIHETKKDIGINAAADITVSKSRTKYSYAIRRTDSAALIKHVAICGHCKSAFPAYHVNLPITTLPLWYMIHLIQLKSSENGRMSRCRFLNPFSKQLS